MDYNNVDVRKFHAGIQFGDPGLIPFVDLSQKDVGQNVSAKLQFLAHGRNIVDRDDCTEHRGQVQYLEGRGCELLIRHWPVAGPEIDGAGLYLLNAAAAADGLIVNLDVGMKLVILAKPLLVNGIRESRSRSGQLLRKSTAKTQR